MCQISNVFLVLFCRGFGLLYDYATIRLCAYVSKATFYLVFIRVSAFYFYLFYVFVIISLLYKHEGTLTYLLTYLLHEAESFLRR